MAILNQNLQELSKTSLKSYISKASKEASTNAFFAGQGNYRSPGDQISKWSKHEKNEKRHKGINKALNKLEEQPLQELSRGKLADYVAAASTDMGNRLKKSHQELSNATVRHNRGDKPEAVQAHSDVADKEYKKASKRQTGIYRAVRKLAK